jgi:hypothetical protein
MTLGFAITVHHHLDEIGRRATFDHWDVKHLAAPGLHEVAADDLVHDPVAALDEDVRFQGLDDVVRIVLFEEGDVIDAVESQEHLSAFGKREEGFQGTFDAFDGSVAIETDDEQVTAHASILQVGDMAQMEQVKNPIGEDYFFALVFKVLEDRR